MAPADPERGALPGSLVAAAMVLLVGGVFAAFAALFLAFLWFVADALPGFAALTEFADLPEEDFRAAADVLWQVAGIGTLVFGAVAIGELAAGAGILGRLGWARILGIVLSALAIVVWGLLFLAAATAGQTDPSLVEAFRDYPEALAAFDRLTTAGTVFGMIFYGLPLVCYAYALVILIWRGSEFE